VSAYDDTFAALLETVQRRPHVVEIIERDDGTFMTGGGFDYIAPFAEWLDTERKATRYVRGRVLDAGAGAGRVSLHLQERGYDVVGIDVSQKVARIARKRGVRDIRLADVLELDPAKIGLFDTVVLFGNNFGMMGTVAKTKRMLRTLHGVTTDGARILAANASPYPRRGDAEYQRRNRERGKLPGTIRIKLRFGKHATPWFDWLFVSPREMKEIVRGTGWYVADVIQGEGAPYVGVLEKS